jgi:hypothetical protein
MSETSENDINDPLTTTAERLESARAIREMQVPCRSAVCEVDLHMHSFCSDGYHSPAGRVFEAWDRRMRAVALTDHDVVDGCAEAVAAGRIFGIDVIPGVEFYTDRPGIEILGWWPRARDWDRFVAAGAGAEVIGPIRAAKREQLSAMVARVPACFARRGFEAEITPDDIGEYVRNGLSTKGDISVILWQKYGPRLREAGLATDVKDVQARYTTQDGELNVPLALGMDLSPAAFVRRLRSWGAVPGLSHPTELRKKEGLGNAALETTIDALAAEGLQAVEVDGWRNGTCPETGRPETEVFAEMIARWNARHPDRPPLLPTNGSDDHNQPGEGLELGCGRERNLRPEWGTVAHVRALRDRAALLNGPDGPPVPCGGAA